MERLRYWLMDYDIRRKMFSVMWVTLVLVFFVWGMTSILKERENNIYPHPQIQ